MNFQGYIALFNFQSANAPFFGAFYKISPILGLCKPIFEDFLKIFISPPPPGSPPSGGETLLNVASIFRLSNRDRKIFRLFSSRGEKEAVGNRPDRPDRPDRQWCGLVRAHTTVAGKVSLQTTVCGNNISLQTPVCGNA